MPGAFLLIASHKLDRQFCTISFGECYTNWFHYVSPISVTFSGPVLRERVSIERFRKTGTLPVGHNDSSKSIITRS
jgi:hypothetical protein